MFISDHWDNDGQWSSDASLEVRQWHSGNDDGGLTHWQEWANHAQKKTWKMLYGLRMTICDSL